MKPCLCFLEQLACRLLALVQFEAGFGSNVSTWEGPVMKRKIIRLAGRKCGARRALAAQVAAGPSKPARPTKRKPRLSSEHVARESSAPEGRRSDHVHIEHFIEARSNWVYCSQRDRRPGRLARKLKPPDSSARDRANRAIGPPHTDFVESVGFEVNLMSAPSRLHMKGC